MNTALRRYVVLGCNCRNFFAFPGISFIRQHGENMAYFVIFPFANWLCVSPMQTWRTASGSPDIWFLISCLCYSLRLHEIIISYQQTLGFEKYRRVINSSLQAMQESDFEYETDLEHEPRMSWSKVASEVIPPTAPSRENIMYQGPGGCIVGK